MQKDEHTKADEKRGLRIKRLKKAIISVFLVLLIVPTILSIIALVQIHHLNQQLKSTNQALQLVTSKLNDLYREMEMQEESASEESVSVSTEANYDEAEETVVMSNVNEGMVRVCLTFDDGPSANTDAILDVLDYYGVQATFFVNGKPGMEEVYQRIVAEGHTLAMHSYSHDYSDVYGDMDSFIDDLDEIQSYLYEVTGVECNYYRFPGGSSNTVSQVEMERCIRYLEACGITYFDWNVDSGDATSGGLTVNEIVDRVVSPIAAGGSDTYVVLLHDTADKVTTVEALSVIIEEIMDMENTMIVPINEYVTPVQHVTVAE